MKKFVFAVLCVISTAYFISCIKNNASSGYTNCTGVEPDKDSSALLKYAGDSIPVMRDTSGLYFQILDSGAGVSPTGSSHLQVSYKARLLDNTIFDSTATSSNLGGIPLSQLIPGWQIGLPKIKKGGHIKLLIPSALAWGCQGSGNAIPPNAPVYFDIYLLDVN
ncbi:MAG: FKBP-type peptidyl-prolyl cis-trans isomerase [Bacteroidota bacterium]|nr:FKBP-type peptidyl-prolyl cis-trans isomerase [Bacteroidota bacterium]MDP4211517.1 FKBP-type peptidyl-prolyl cis-trans isomerase [Bacteroidota bacterium]MDP4249732.1 FKBP-type peptidyl-prolyl cis-trans isomerase [Bacteroidota bacterium]